MDIASGARRAVRYLRELGHRRGGEGWSAEAGYEAMKGLLERAPDLTAVFCANDPLAIGALSALSESSRRVPEEVSVIGFDDSELLRRATPPLTTMRIYSRNMARMASRRLLERIENRDQPPVRIEFPIDLVVRRSCMSCGALLCAWANRGAGPMRVWLRE
jgi:DNA-binding LacI/PurR family transcriptional regulator